MGVFFKQSVPPQNLKELFADALRKNPANVSDPEKEAAELAAKVSALSVPEFSWGRALGALIFIVVVCAMGIACAKLGVTDWSAALLHAFQIILGVVVGLLGGEAGRK